MVVVSRTAPFPNSCASYFRFTRFSTFPLYYLRAWHRLVLILLGRFSKTERRQTRARKHEERTERDFRCSVLLLCHWSSPFVTPCGQRFFTICKVVRVACQSSSWRADVLSVSEIAHVLIVQNHISNTNYGRVAKQVLRLRELVAIILKQ